MSIDKILHEECGVFGVIAPEAANVANYCYYGTDIDSEEHLVACHHST